MAEVAFHPEAQAEYEEAWAWYAVRSERAALRFEAEVERVLGLIADSLQSYPRYDDEEHRFAVLRRYPYRVV